MKNEYLSSTYNCNGYEREVSCPAGKHIIYISEARKGKCQECQEEKEENFEFE